MTWVCENYYNWHFNEFQLLRKTFDEENENKELSQNPFENEYEINKAVTRWLEN